MRVKENCVLDVVGFVISQNIAPTRELISHHKQANNSLEAALKLTYGKLLPLGEGTRSPSIRELQATQSLDITVSQ